MTIDPAPLDAALAGYELHKPITTSDLQQLGAELAETFSCNAVAFYVDGVVKVCVGHSETLRREGLVRVLPVLP